MIGPSGIAPLAQRQLAAWQQLAADWPLLVERRTEASGLKVLHHVCAECFSSVFALQDQAGQSFRVTPQHVLDATVMHLRARHADLEPAGL
jgi:hypothetical protein